MFSIFSKNPGRHLLLGLFIGIFAMLPLLLSACGSSSSTGSSSTPTASCGPTPTASSSTPVASAATPTLTKPADLITSGTLTVGSDTTYPPQEFINTSTGTATGFDVDLITAMAQKLGLKAKIVTANFNTIIDDLVAKRYDVVISAITINSAREQKASFVPYFNSGESLLVPQGNPKNLQCVANLCGLSVGVQDGTVELDDLNAANKHQCASNNIKLTVLTDQTEVIQLLANHRVDATYQDSPVTDYYIKQNPGQFQIGGSVVNAAPEGIAVRKNDSGMLNAMQGAFNAVKSDGTYDQLFSKWQLNSSQKISMVGDWSTSPVANTGRRTMYALQAKSLFLASQVL